jgi:cysteinyl-tRNA synthetase
VREANRATSPAGDADLLEMLAVLGLDTLLDVTTHEPPAEVRELSDARELARRDRNYAEADRLRDQIGVLGWEVRDGPGGPELLPTE